MITFQVSEVEKATASLLKLPLKTIIGVEPFPDMVAANFEPVIRKTEGFPKDKEDLVFIHFKHAFIGTIWRAFNEHYPIVLSPDMIWLLIAQGFTSHVNLNAEKLRHLFVAHEDKKTLEVRRDNFVKGENNDWANVFPEFVAHIKQNIKSDVHEVIATEFSTTTPTEKAVFELTLMDSMSAYFEYEVGSICGIPEITLLGTVADWQKIIDHAKKLAQYELQWWIEPLLPILEKIKDTAQGNIDKEFWQSMFKYSSMSGSQEMSGWLVYFFPYIERKIWGRNEEDLSEYRTYIADEEGLESVNIKQMVIEEDYIEEMHTVKNRNCIDTYSTEQERWEYPALELHSLLKGTTSTPFLWKYLGTQYEMEFIAGFVGASQDEKTLSLKPEIAWAVAEK